MRHYCFVGGSPSQGLHGVLSHYREVMNGRYFSWKETKLSLVEVELQVVCRHPPRDISYTQISAATWVSDQVKEDVSCKAAVVGKNM